MHLKVTYRDMKRNSIKIEKHGLQSQKASPPINDLVVSKLIWLSSWKYQTPNSTQPAIKILKIRYKVNPTIKQDTKPSDKTSNMYRLTKDEDNKMRRDPVTSTYEKTKRKIKKKERISWKSHLTLLIQWISSTPQRMNVEE